MCNLATVPPGEISDKNGQIYSVTDWIAFCNERDLEKYSIWKLVTGISSIHHGWTLPNARKAHPNAGEYVFYDISGKTYHVIGLHGFCKKNKLSYAGLMALVVGKSHASQGLAMSMEGFKKRTRKYIVTLENNGREVTLRSIKKEALSIGIYPRFVYDLIRGKKQIYNGWRVKSIETDYRIPRAALPTSFEKPLVT
jgi:hypothetical protein